MKRTFVIAVLTGTLAIPSVAALAANPNGAVVNNGPNSPAPNQAIGGMNNMPNRNVAANPQGNMPQAGNPGVNPNMGNGAPAANVVQDGGQGGAVANSGLSFAANLKEIHGRLDGQALGAAPVAVANGAPAGGPVAGGSVVAEVKQEIKAPEHGAEIVQQLFNFCRNRSIRRAFGPGFGPGMPPMFMQGGFMPQAPAPFGDLVLVNVGLVSEATPVQGPIYRVTMLNDSPMPSFGFHVSLIAVMGEMNDSSVVVTVPVRVIGPKATLSIDIRMPANVMSIGNPGQPFDTLIAVVDSFDELAETNELNNVATLSRVDVVTVTVKTETTEAVAVNHAAAPAQVSTTVQSGPATVAPANGPAVAAPAVAAPAVVNGAAPSGPPAPANGVAPAVAPAGPAPAPAPAQDPQAAPAPATPVAPAQGGETTLPDLDKVDGASQILKG